MKCAGNGLAITSHGRRNSGRGLCGGGSSSVSGSFCPDLTVGVLNKTGVNRWLCMYNVRGFKDCNCPILEGNHITIPYCWR